MIHKTILPLWMLFSGLFPQVIAARVHEVVLMGLNDLHGALVPRDYMSTETSAKSSVSYQMGGAAVLAGYANILREQYGERLLILDAGDEWQGSMESNVVKGKSMVAFLNQLGLAAATIGNHEFDFGPESEAANGAKDRLGAMRARLAEAKYPYVSANIYHQPTGKPLKMVNLVANTILNAGGIKVGIVGLTTEQTPNTTARKNIVGLEFRNLAATAKAQSAILRKQGAQIIVVLAHAGALCHHHHTKALGEVVTEPQASACDAAEKDEIVKLLAFIPAGTVDAVVSGHTHTVIHHWINHVPVVQAGKYGEVFNLVHLFYDDESKKLISEKAQIEGPIPVCEKVFQNQKDCNGKKKPPASGRGELVAATFHGKTLALDPKVQAIVSESGAKAAAQKSEVLGEAAFPIVHLRDEESPMGNLVTDAIRETAHTDFALINAGGIRDNLEKGQITRGDLFRVLPFENYISILRVTGKQLKLILRVAESGVKGVFPISGLKLVLKKKVPAPMEDLDGDGKKEAWEVDRITSIRTTDGTPLDDKKQYSLATCDFLATGGDYMGWPMSQVPRDKVKEIAGPTVRDAAAAWIAQRKVINTAEKPLVDLKSARVLFGNDRP